MTNSVLSDIKSLNDLSASCALDTKQACIMTGMMTYSQELFTRWPNIREAVHRLSDMLTLYWPDTQNPKSPLLVSTLQYAFKEAKFALNQYNSDEEEIIQFVNAITKQLQYCLMTTLMIKYKGMSKAYEADVDGPLGKLLRDKQHTVQRLIWYEYPTTYALNTHMQLILASKVFTIRDLDKAGII